MAKTLALGTALYVEDPDTPDSFIKVGNLSAIPSLPGPEKNEVDVTDFDSTAVETLGDLPDNGEFTFSGYYNDEDAGQEVLFADANDTDSPVRDFRIEFPRQNVQFTFTGWVRRFRPTATAPRAAYGFEGAIRVTGAVNKAVITT